ncbi:MAG: hypothetical protein U0931_34655 [Vulcanimicrobiota bacterium]
MITRRQGLSLLEMTVACSMFLAMVTVLFGLLTQNRRASVKASGHTDTTTEAMLVVERMRTELRTSRVVGVSPQGALLYWRARLQDGLPLLDAQGRIDWLPGAPADPDVAELIAARGFLRRTFQGTRQNLASLGPGGHLQFGWNAALSNLTLYGELGTADPQDPTRNNLQPFVYQLYLSNTE